MGDYAIYANEPNTQVLNQNPPSLAVDPESPYPVFVKLLLKPTELEAVFISKTNPEPIGKTKTINISPNPATDLLHLEWPAEDILFGEILDAAGRSVRTFLGKTDLEIVDLPAGVFTVEIKTRDGRAIGRFVKI